MKRRLSPISMAGIIAAERAAYRRNWWRRVDSYEWAALLMAVLALAIAVAVFMGWYL